MSAPALIDCPDCKRQVSSQADKCPGCGRPMKEPAQSTTGILAAIIIGLIGAGLLYLFIRSRY